eukprot:scaffold4247_cov174-Ochromonas_danica.AAC.12
MQVQASQSQCALGGKLRWAAAVPVLSEAVQCCCCCVCAVVAVLARFGCARAAPCLRQNMTS